MSVISKCWGFLYQNKISYDLWVKRKIYYLKLMKIRIIYSFIIMINLIWIIYFVIWRFKYYSYIFKYFDIRIFIWNSLNILPYIFTIYIQYIFHLTVLLKGLHVDVIIRDPSFIDWHVWLTITPFKSRIYEITIIFSLQFINFCFNKRDQYFVHLSSNQKLIKTFYTKIELIKMDNACCF